MNKIWTPLLMDFFYLICNDICDLDNELLSKMEVDDQAFIDQCDKKLLKFDNFKEILE